MYARTRFDDITRQCCVSESSLRKKRLWNVEVEYVGCSVPGFCAGGPAERERLKSLHWRLFIVYYSLSRQKAREDQKTMKTVELEINIDFLHTSSSVHPCGSIQLVNLLAHRAGNQSYWYLPTHRMATHSLQSVSRRIRHHQSMIDRGFERPNYLKAYSSE